MRMKQFLFNAAINFKIFISSLVNLLNPEFFIQRFDTKFNQILTKRKKNRGIFFN